MKTAIGRPIIVKYFKWEPENSLGVPEDFCQFLEYAPNRNFLLLKNNRYGVKKVISNGSYVVLDELNGLHVLTAKEFEHFFGDSKDEENVKITIKDFAKMYSILEDMKKTVGYSTLDRSE